MEKKQIIDAVFDTSVMVSALLWKGLPNDLLLLVEQGNIRLHTSLQILEELEEVLSRNKFSKRIKELNTTAEKLTYRIAMISEIYSIEHNLKIINQDEDDNMFLTCALYSGANYIISGDKHLLELRNYEHIKIMKPREFLKEISRNKQLK